MDIIIFFILAREKNKYEDGGINIGKLLKCLFSFQLFFKLIRNVRWIKIKQNDTMMSKHDIIILLMNVLLTK